MPADWNLTSASVHTAESFGRSVIQLLLDSWLDTADAVPEQPGSGATFYRRVTVQVERVQDGDFMLLLFEEPDGSKRYGRISVGLPPER